MITDTEGSSAIVSSIVHNEDGDVKNSEASMTHETVQGSEHAVPSTIGITSDVPNAVSFPSFSSFFLRPDIDFTQTEKVTLDSTTRVANAASSSASPPTSDVKIVQTNETITSGRDPPSTKTEPGAPVVRTSDFAS